MPRLPRVAATDALRAVQRDGWQIARQSGSHAQLTHPTKPGRVTIAIHSRDIIPAKTLRKIIRQAGLTDDHFRDLLWRRPPMPRYTVLLYPDEGNYSVVVPALDGCVTWGHTVDEALAMARDAIQLHLTGLAEDGEEIPEEDEPPVVAAIDVPLPVIARV